MYLKNLLLIPSAMLVIGPCVAPRAVYAADRHAVVKMQLTPKTMVAARSPFVLFQTQVGRTATPRSRRVLATASPTDEPPATTSPPAPPDDGGTAKGNDGTDATTTPAPAAPASPPAETSAEADAPEDAVSVVVPLYYFTDAPGVIRILRPADAKPLNETAYKEALSAVTSARRDVADKEEARRTAYEAVLAARNDAGQAQVAASAASSGAATPHSGSPAVSGTDGEAAANLTSATQALDATQQQLDAALADAQVKEAAYAKETEEWEAGIYDKKDRLRRVYIRTAGTGQLFLRGASEDVNRVRQAIAKLDQPVPQMRVTLWTVQVSGQGAQGDAASRQRLATAVNQVEEDMGLLRRQLAASSDLFQECVEAQVHSAAIAARSDTDVPKHGGTEALPNSFYFYDPDVLARLGFKSDVLLKTGSAEIEPISQALYLHPDRVNSLGETLLTLLLAKENYRKAALQAYLHNAPNLLAQMHEEALTRSGMMPKDIVSLKLEDKYKERIQMERLLAAFGYRRAAGESLEGLTGSTTPDSVQRQQEYAVNIIRAALQQIHRQEALNHWGSLIDTFREEDKKVHPKPEDKAVFDAKTVQDAKTVCDSVCSYFTGIATDLAASRSAQDGTQQAMEDLNVTDYKDLKDPPVTITTPEQMEALSDRLEDKDVEDLAQMAVGDQIIKQFVVAAEDDLDAELIRPSLRNLQKDASQKSVELGIVQRTSILAGDRRSARVDPKASIEFSFPQPADLLQESVDLVKLVAKGTGAGVAANLTALAGTGDAGKVLDKLMDINNKRQTPPPDIYKIETGSGFTLTPILLPDAENMAFDLDYSLSSPVTEPQDTKGRRIAQIERHGLQTYVQDGSFELRELSRFESSVKLAQPVIRSGGIPLLREIPGVRDIPILGYFSKSAGAGMGLQESLIFVHTVQYPTVKSLIPLF